MKPLPRIAAVLLVGSFAPVVVAAEDASREVKAVLDRQVEDWNRGDLDGFCNGYWKSSKLLFLSGGEKRVGWEEMHERYKRSYKAEGKEMGKLAFSDLGFETLGPDVTMANGRWDLKLSAGKEKGGRFTVILRKFPEGWRIIHDHTSVDAS